MGGSEAGLATQWQADETLGRAKTGNREDGVRNTAGCINTKADGTVLELDSPHRQKSLGASRLPHVDDCMLPCNGGRKLSRREQYAGQEGVKKKPE